MPKSKSNSMKKFWENAKDKIEDEEELKVYLPLIIQSVGKNEARHLTAKVLIKKLNIITLKDTKEIFYYNDGIYHPDGESVIESEVQNLWSDLATTHDINEIIGHIKRMTYADRKIFDEDKFKICVKNGILNLMTGELEEFSPEKKHIIRIPVKYDPEADCPKIKKFVSEIVDEENVPLIQEMFGYCLLKDYRYNKAFMLLGEGSNGKSTLLNLLVKFLGEENVSNPSLQQLCYDKFAQHELYGKLANINNELPSTKIANSGMFKMLTGEDLIRAEKKHKDSFKFRNHAKLIFATNQLPETNDISVAFFRRWIIINFPNVFEKDKADPTLLEKLTTDEELSGLLNWAMEGLRRIIENNGFSETKARKDIENEWILRTDSLRAFVDSCIEYDPDSMMEKDVFYEEYCKFCEEHDVKPFEKSVVGRKLTTILPKVRTSRPKIGGQRVMVWVGIKKKENAASPVKDKTFQVKDRSKNMSAQYINVKDVKDFFSYKNKIKKVNYNVHFFSDFSDIKNNLDTDRKKTDETDTQDETDNLAFTERDDAHLILNLIRELCEKSEDGMADLTSLREDFLMLRSSVPETEALLEFEKLIAELRFRGYIYEPKQGKFMLAEG